MEEDGFGFDLNIVIVGLGLIGGSYAKALKTLSPRKIYGIDIDKEVIGKAKEMKIIDDGDCDGSEFLKTADLVIIALYPKDTVKFVKDNICNFKCGAIITDTCGIKQIIIEEINSFLPETVEFVGAHPMAGKETWGLESASEDIFKGANFIITPCSKNSERSILLIEKVAKAMGCRNIVQVNPDEHDRIVTYTSQLPHIIAVSLIYSNTFSDKAEGFIGGSFKDVTRVAAINSKLWTELFALNSDNLINEIEIFEKAMETIKEAIKSQNKNALESIFASAGQKRRMML